jgi:hypothetical protein
MNNLFTNRLGLFSKAYITATAEEITKKKLAQNLNLEMKNYDAEFANQIRIFIKPSSTQSFSITICSQNNTLIASLKTNTTIIHSQIQNELQEKKILSSNQDLLLKFSIR